MNFEEFTVIGSWGTDLNSWRNLIVHFLREFPYKVSSLGIIGNILE